MSKLRFLLGVALLVGCGSSKGGGAGAPGDGGGLPDDGASPDSSMLSGSSGGSGGSTSDATASSGSGGTGSSGSGSGSSSGNGGSSGSGSSGGSPGSSGSGSSSGASGGAGSDSGASSSGGSPTDAGADGGAGGGDASDANAAPPVATAVSAGQTSACAIYRGGTLRCWGNDSAGQLGVGGSVSDAGACAQGPCATSPVEVPGISDAYAVSVGQSSACVLLVSGAVECWGDNSYGELGNGAISGPATCGSFGAPCSPTPVTVSGLTSPIAISVGTVSACALQSDRTVMCWGDDTYGELGAGSTSDAATCSSGPCSPTPVAVTGISDAIAISVGDGAACALLSAGTLACWGLNADGELGDPDAGSFTSTPVAVPGLSGVTAVSVDAVGNTCALLSDATVQCWGNDYERTTPGAGVTDLANATGVSGFCALVYGGTVSCWQPVAGDASTPSAAAETGVTGATGISGSGSAFACASLASGSLSCWGDNSYGQLGNGSTTSSSAPVTIE